jgi:hypothetical protein
MSAIDVRSSTDPGQPGRSTASGALLIVATGVILGVAYNALAAGLPWIAEDRAQDVARLELPVDPPTAGVPAAAGAPAPDPASYRTDETDPMAIAAPPPPRAAPAATALPEIPDLGRPILIELGAAKQFHDAGAALFVDAREAD